jgi:soluble lytic murein transglycosylase-like protein
VPHLSKASLMVVNKFKQFNALRVSLQVIAKLLLLVGFPVSAELYIYQGPNGERLATDRPVPEYVLLSTRDTFTDVGHILANRSINTGGPTSYTAHIRIASEKYMVDAALIEAIIEVESGFNPDAVSKSGATGLMQLMPGTAKDLDVADRYSPRQNIHGGVKYLSELIERFNNDLPLVLAAYNAGPSSVDKYSGIPPYPETQRYVKKVMASYHNFRLLRYGEP